MSQTTTSFAVVVYKSELKTVGLDTKQGDEGPRWVLDPGERARQAVPETTPPKFGTEVNSKSCLIAWSNLKTDDEAPNRLAPPAH